MVSHLLGWDSEEVDKCNVKECVFTVRGRHDCLLRAGVRNELSVQEKLRGTRICRGSDVIVKWSRSSGDTCKGKKVLKGVSKGMKPYPGLKLCHESLCSSELTPLLHATLLVTWDEWKLIFLSTLPLNESFPFSPFDNNVRMFRAIRSVLVR